MGHAKVAPGNHSARTPNRHGRRAGVVSAHNYPSLADSMLSRVNPATSPRPCRGRAERRYVRKGPPPQYPFYYVTHAVVIPERVDADGRVTRPAERRPLCDDCHNNELLQHRVAWERFEAEDGKARADDGVLVTPAADPDRSVSGEAIAALGDAIVRDADGEACGLELAESPLLPDSDAALLLEIKAGILAGDDVGAYRQVMDRYKRAARAARMVPIVV